MNDPEYISRRGIQVPRITLLAVSVAGCALALMRVLLSKDWSYLFLVWNLFLAWLPLVFARAACRHYRADDNSGWQFYLYSTLWLLFFPNAPYIFTDLIHLNNWFAGHYWVDMSLILIFAFAGFLVGFLSLYLMQVVVAARFGCAASWLFIVVVAGLSSFGVFLGRFMRRNSWDVVLHPADLGRDLHKIALHPFTAHGLNLAFPLVFSAFLFLGYVMLYGLTHMQPNPSPEAA